MDRRATSSAWTARNGRKADTMTDRDGDRSRAGQLVGPGAGGSPAPGDRPTDDERRDAAADPDVRRLVRNLDADEPREPLEMDEAAEHAGSGTDR